MRDALATALMLGLAAGIAAGPAPAQERDVDPSIGDDEIVEDRFPDVEGDDKGLVGEEFDLREDDLGIEDEEIVDDDLSIDDPGIAPESDPLATERDRGLDRLGLDRERGLDQDEPGLDEDLSERYDLGVGSNDLGADPGIGGGALGTGGAD